VNVVNGFYCVTCADESMAKQGIDPSTEHAKTDLAAREVEATQLGVNQPKPGAEVGSSLNLYA
jgi:hypothetical protein